MQKALTFLLVLSILAANLASAANACLPAADRSMAPMSLESNSDEPSDATADATETDECADCQGSCFCACHSGLVTVVRAHVEPAIPQTPVSDAERAFASHVSLPYVPPPIATLSR